MRWCRRTAGRDAPFFAGMTKSFMVRAFTALRYSHPLPLIPELP
jgi:hypothetical protein